MSTFRPHLALIPAFTALVPCASAQLASALVRETDPLPGAGPGITISAIGSSACNQAGGWAVRATSIGGGPTAHVVGNPSGGAAATLRSNQSGIAGYNQTGFEDFHGFGDLGEIGYSPTCTEISSGATGLDCAWLDGTPIAVEAQPIMTLPGKVFRFNSRVGITGNGTIYWVGGINDGATGTNEGEGLFFGPGQTVVVKTGDPAPAPLLSQVGSTDFDVRYSALGTRYILGLDTTDATTADAHLVSNGVILLDAGGNRISEGQVVSPAAGGNGVELYANFGSLGINEAGDFFFEGDTNATTTADGILVKNGVILMREGQTYDGATLLGDALSSGSYMNEQGDWVTSWNTVGALEALFVNGDLVLREGDMVDWDGDGVLDANTAVTDITGTASVVIGPRTVLGTDVYFTADVNVGGTVLEGFFRLRIPSDPLTSFCFGDASSSVPCPCGNTGATGRGCENSATTGGAQLTATGTTNPDTIVFTSSGELPTALSIFLQGDSQLVPPTVFGDGLRCVGGNLKRLYTVNAVGGVVSAPGPGDPSVTAQSAALGDPIAPGSLRFYQVYYRDPDLAFCPNPPGNSWNVSNGIRIAW